MSNHPVPFREALKTMFRPLSFPRLQQQIEKETPLESALKDMADAVATVEKKHGLRMQDCIFCQIIRGESPATIVREWPMVLAIKPLKQVTEDHVLLLPKIHVDDYTSRPEVSAMVMMAAAEYAPNPSNLWSSAGAVAFQTVFHFHLHVLPRTEGDGMVLPEEKD